MRSAVSVRSHAKINLGLRILGKRGDGYHDIETLFHTIELSDRLFAKEAEKGIHVACSFPGVPQDSENIVFAAAQRTLEAAGSTKGVSIEIEKQIPPGGGLGGASTNAAAAIEALDHLFTLGLPLKKKCEIARELGSDVPFFVRGGAAVGTGKGDELEYIKARAKFDLVVVYPGFPISTRWAYEKANSGLTQVDFDINILGSALKQGDLDSLCRGLHNSFEEVVFKYHPELCEIKRKMIGLGALGALLTGSGSCVFCIVRDGESARTLASEFKRDGLSAWATATC
jgi:4-diphosphocytidyl-2-C-methyl-D-erythritol kinase